MDDKILDEIKIILKSIVLQDQSNNIFDSNFINGLKFENNNDKNIIEEIKSHLDKSFGNNFNFRRVENVGPKVSAELLKSGVIAISVALFLCRLETS